MTASRPDWRDLEGLFADEVLHAPKTHGDPSAMSPPVDGRVVAYLQRNVAGTPWADQLALLAAILTARRRDAATIATTVRNLNCRFRTIFGALELHSFADWKPNAMMPAYLKGEIGKTDGEGVRQRFWPYYNAASRQLKRWSESLPASEQHRYAAFLLPLTDRWLVEDLLRNTQLQRQAEEARKADTDALLPYLMDLRATAHLRYNLLARVRQAYLASIAHVQTGQTELPYTFAVDEGADSVRGLPPAERLHFRLWNRQSFVLHHPEQYAEKTRRQYQLRGTWSARSKVSDRYYLEFLAAERLRDTAPPEGLWFADLLRECVVITSPQRLKRDPCGLAFLHKWGYVTEDGKPFLKAFRSQTSGVLAWSHVDAQFIQPARAKTGGLLIPIEELFAAATFGLLAIDLFTTTGMRINEAMQVRLSADCYSAEQWPAPVGAKDQEPRTRWAFQLIPKGERTDTPSRFYIGKETHRLISKVVWYLGIEHYQLGRGQPLRSVRFCEYSTRAHRFKPGPYLFQFGRRHLHQDTIAVCMRFLMHGLAFKTRDGRNVILRPHLLRHAFATHALQVVGLPIDIVRELLNQKDVEVTYYYGKPTPTMVADAAESLLDSMGRLVDIGKALERAPEDLRRMVSEAQQKVGAVAEVIGGTCVQPGFCPAKFACIGCPANATDPSKRPQLMRRAEWLEQQRCAAIEDGLLPEANRLEQQLRDAGTMLREMDLIEQYHRDEQQAASFIPMADLS